LKVRIPKAGAYMDTKQEVKSELDDLSLYTVFGLVSIPVYIVE
jgi:hypothetical protein